MRTTRSLILYLLLFSCGEIVSGQTIDLTKNWEVEAQIGINQFCASSSVNQQVGGTASFVSVAVQNNCFRRSSLRGRFSSGRIVSSNSIVPGYSVLMYARQYVMPSVDWLLSVQSLMSDKPSDWDIQPFIGGGLYLPLEKSRGEIQPMVNVGVKGELEFSRNAAIVAQLNTSLLPNSFDRIDSHRSIDALIELSIGVRYHFGEKARPRRAVIEPLVKIMRDTVVVEKQMIVHIPSPEVIQQKDTIREAEIMDVVEEPQSEHDRAVAKALALRLCEYPFGLNEVEIRNESCACLDSVALYLQNNPQAKIVVRSLVDKTGSLKVRQRVALDRAQRGKHALLQYKNISEDQIIMLVNEPMNPFLEDADNRIIFYELYDGELFHIPSAP